MNRLRERVDRGRERLAKVVLAQANPANERVPYPRRALHVTSPRQRQEIFSLWSEKMNTRGETAEKERAYREANPDKELFFELGAEAIREVITGTRNR